MFSKLHKALFGLAVFAGVAAASGAQAQTFTFAGNTTGAFTGDNVTGLSFANGSFKGKTSEGYLGVGSNATNNLGTFTSSGESGSTKGLKPFFTLTVNFTMPSGTTPSPGTFSADVTGSVTYAPPEDDGSFGGFTIDFDNSFKTFQFNGGTFALSVNDVSVFAGQTVSVTGTILAAPGPVAGAGIPVAVLGLVGFLHFRSRRKLLQA